MISQHEKQLLKLLDGVLHSTPIPHIDTEDWEPLYKEMKAQCVSILPSDYMDEFPLIPEQAEKYWGLVGKAIQYFYNILLEQSDVVSILQDAGIAVAVLKGVAAAMNYPHPEYRSMGDIDLIVPQEQFADAYHALIDHGYKVEGADIDQMFDRHISFIGPSGIEIELHHHFSSNLTKKQNHAFDIIISDAIEKAIYTNVNGFEVPVLPPAANGLVLLGHIQHHLKNGLGLRQIIDWMMYVEKYLDDEFWNTEFKNLVERIGLKKLAMVSTQMCQKYLGLDPGITWCQDGENEEICDKLLEYVVKRGNFGRKMDSLQLGLPSRLQMLKNPIEILQMAQKHGTVKWKLLNKYPWLRPFAWIYQLIVWPIHAIQHGYTPEELLKNRKQANAEVDLFEKLED